MAAIFRNFRREIACTRGLAACRADRYDLAIRSFTRAIRLDPECAVAFANRGGAYNKK
jgi:Flp pilus assembly protein TadD